jgi:ferredoxin-NADP reductase
MNDPKERLRWQAATIAAVETATPNIRLFRLTPDRWLPFQAGQHLEVRLTAPDGYQARRSYSVTSAPDQAGEYELAIERLADGEVSPYFHDVAAPGDRIEIRGPLGGHFVWPDSSPDAVLLVGGGSGLAPLVAMARQRALTGGSSPMALLAGFRSWDYILFRDELLELEARTGLALAFALSREEARRPADFGRRIDGPVLAEVTARLPRAPELVFVCGSNAFVDAVTGPLQDLGVPASIIRTERYGG